MAVIDGENASVRLDDFVLPHPGRYVSFDVTHQAYLHEGLDQVVHYKVDKVNVPEAAYGHPTSQEVRVSMHAARTRMHALSPVHPLQYTHTYTYSTFQASMMRHMSELVTEAEGSTTKWGEYTLKTQLVLDTILASARKDGAWVEMEGGL